MPIPLQFYFLSSLSASYQHLLLICFTTAQTYILIKAPSKNLSLLSQLSFLLILLAECLRYFNRVCPGGRIFFLSHSIPPLLSFPYTSLIPDLSLVYPLGKKKVRQS